MPITARRRGRIARAQPLALLLSALCFGIALAPALILDLASLLPAAAPTITDALNCGTDHPSCSTFVKLVASGFLSAVTLSCFLVSFLLLGFSTASHSISVKSLNLQYTGWLGILMVAQVGAPFSEVFDWRFGIIPALAILIFINCIDAWHTSIHRWIKIRGAGISRTKLSLYQGLVLTALPICSIAAGSLTVYRGKGLIPAIIFSMLCVNFGAWTLTQLSLKTRNPLSTSFAGWMFQTLILMNGTLLLHSAPSLRLSLLISMLIVIISAAWMTFILATLASSPRLQRASADYESLQQELLDTREISKADLISQRDHAEESIQKQREFLATMSHELRTPLSCIVGLARLWAQEAETSKEAQQDMGTIERMSVQLLRIVDDGLAYVSRDNANSPTAEDAVQLDHLIGDLHSIAKWLSSQNMNEFTLLYTTDLPAHLVFDEKRTRQILINLLSNAARFCSNGRITLGVELKNLGERNFLNWVVRDTGRGMTKEDLHRYLSPFTKSRDSQGLGLGLTISQRLAQEMEGKLDIQSRAGGGTVVEVLIPVKPICIFTNPTSSTSSTSSQSSHAIGAEFLASTPITLMPDKAYEHLDFTSLRTYIKFGQITEISHWIAQAKLSAANTFARELLLQLERAHRRIDLEGMRHLIDEAETSYHLRIPGDGGHDSRLMAEQCSSVMADTCRVF